MANIITPEFRVSYPNVFKPQEIKRDDGTTVHEYSLVALFPKGANLDALKKEVIRVMTDKFGPDRNQWPDNWRNPLRDQGEKKRIDKATGKVILGEDGKPLLHDGCEAGAVFINMKSKQKPGVVDQNVQDIIDETQFYAGCWARASVSGYWYDHKGNRGVAFGLRNIQKLRDGEPLGGRTRPEDDFEPIDTGDGDAGGEGNPATSLFD